MPVADADRGPVLAGEVRELSHRSPDVGGVILVVDEHLVVAFGEAEGQTCLGDLAAHRALAVHHEQAL